MRVLLISATLLLAGCGFFKESDDNQGTGDPCIDMVVEDWNLEPYPAPLFPGQRVDLGWLTAGKSLGVPGRLPATIDWPGVVIGGDTDGAAVTTPMEVGEHTFKLVLDGCPAQSQEFTFEVIAPNVPAVDPPAITGFSDSVAWSPDGAYYVATIESVLVLFAPDGTPQTGVAGPFGKGITFSPDGAMLAVGEALVEAGPGDKRSGSLLFHVDGAELTPYTSWPEGHAAGAGFSADSRFYYTTAANPGLNPAVYRLDLQTGERQVLRPAGEGDRPGDNARYLKVWDGIGWDGLHLFEPVTGLPFELATGFRGQGAFRPDLNRALMVKEGAFRVWQIFPGVILDEAFMLAPGVTNLILNPAGDTALAIGGGDSGSWMIRLSPDWTSTEAQFAVPHPGTATDAAWSPDGEVLVIATEEGLHRFTSTELARFEEM